jgi:hypothetical protein
VKKQKRREGQLVQLKIRIRESLRNQLEHAAKQEEIPLTHEIVRRVEKTFEQDQLFVLLEYMLAPGMSMDLFKALARILVEHGPNWEKGPYRHVAAQAIYKVIAVYIGELSPTAESFPEQDHRGSADWFAWDALIDLRLPAPPPPDDEQLADREFRRIEDEQRRFRALAPSQKGGKS